MLKFATTLMMVFFISLHSPILEFSVKHVKFLDCSTRPTAGPWVNVEVRVQVKNTSDEVKSIGLLEIGQDRLSTRNALRGLVLSKRNPVGDTFRREDEVDQQTGDFVNIDDKPVLKGEVKDVTYDHSVLVQPSDVQFEDGQRKIYASFYISNLLRDGSFLDYWTDPLAITIREECNVVPFRGVPAK